MNNCRKFRNQFVEALYEDLTQEQNKKFQSHLADCPECAAEFEKMSSVLTMMDQREREEPHELFWENYWDNLSEKMFAEAEKESLLKKWQQRILDFFRIEPTTVYRFAGAASLILVGIIIGKLYFGRVPTSAEMAIPHLATVEQSAVQVRADRYIERSKVLLLGLVNFEADGEDSFALNMPHQKKISRELVHEAAYLKNELDQPAQEQLKMLVSELEIILMQISNMEADLDLEGIEMLKAGVDRKGVLLKINLEQMQQEINLESQVEKSSKKGNNTI